MSLFKKKEIKNHTTNNIKNQSSVQASVLENRLQVLKICRPEK